MWILNPTVRHALHFFQVVEGEDMILGPNLKVIYFHLCIDTTALLSKQSIA